MTKDNHTTKVPMAPKYRAYHVTEAKGRGQKDRWNQIGAYFEHIDGQGGTLILDSLPIAFDGKVVLRAPKTETGAGE